MPKGTSITEPAQLTVLHTLTHHYTRLCSSVGRCPLPLVPLTPTRALPAPLATMRRSPVPAATALLVAVAVAVLLPLASAASKAAAAAPAAAKAKAKAPAAPPAPPNITALMSKGGCKSFASLVSKSPDALSAFQSAVEGGVTAFCPTDDALRPFMPRYRNLTADGEASLLLFHAVPVYYTLRGLKSSNGPMNTLATDGGSRGYNFTVQNVGDQVSIRTAASDAAARVRSTVYDRDPVAIYAVDAVLEPVELFDPAEAPAPAPAPAAADAPRASGKAKRGHRPRHVADAPGPAADDDAAADDQRKNAKKNAAPGGRCSLWLAAAVAVAAAFV